MYCHDLEVMSLNHDQVELGAHGTSIFLPLDVDSINENDSVANPDPTPRIASAHKSRFAEAVLVGCWIEAVYYGFLLFTIT